MKNKVYAAGLYLRLSRDDGEGESASIGNQRKILQAYAKEHGFPVYDEYVDDGWSGTSFDRPGWRRMLADIDEKRVNLVLTKDLSRLGRDYITAGQYTELYFPARGVRCIAINDGYDSESPYTDIAPFKNIVNEMYARDASKKIRSALRAKMNEGAFIGNHAPFGYQKDPENKNHLLPDPVSAPIVRELFRFAEEGAAPGEIAASLNTRGVPTPSRLRKVRSPCSTGAPSEQWTSSMVCKLLANPVYLGHVAQGKTTKVSFKSPVTLRNSREDWIVARHMHEPLVTPETFERVRQRRVSRRNPPRSGFQNIFSGIAFCGDCGRAMSVTASRRKGAVYSLVCGGYKLHGIGACTNHFMDYSALYDVVLGELKSLVALDGEEKQRLLATMRARPEEEKLPDEADSIRRRELELDRIIARLYEDSAAGRLDEMRFYKLLAAYEAEQRMLTDRLSTSLTPPPKAAPPDLDALLQKGTLLSDLSPALLRNWIDRIEVLQGAMDETGRRRQEVRIFYKCGAPCA